MKRLFALCLALCLCVIMQPVTVFAADENLAGTAHTSDADISSEEYRIAPINLFPFVYTEGSAVWYEENIIGENDCKLGYMYVKNFDTGEITQILDEPVISFCETLENLYCVTEDQKIVMTDYSGEQHILLYEAVQGAVESLRYYNGSLYFIESNSVIRLDLADLSTAAILKQEGIVSVNPFSDTELIWRNTKDEAYYFYTAAGKSVLLESGQEENAVLGLETYDVPDAIELIPPDAEIQAVTEAVDFPLPEYPVGSHFCSGGICDHANGVYYCRYYANTRQCDGFAYYAHDRYNHRSGSAWVEPDYPAGDSFVSGGEIKAVPVGTSTSEVRIFFETKTKGAFVRYTKTETDAGGFHSAVFISMDSTGIWVYECNQDDKCGVSYTHYNFSSFLGRYPYAAIYISHTFPSRATSLTASVHKYACANCSAYVTEAHRAYTPGNNASCARCGYVGKIDLQCPLD